METSSKVMFLKIETQTDVTEEPAAWCYSGSQPAQSWLVAATNDSTTNDSAPFHSMHSRGVYVVPLLTRAFKYVVYVHTHTDWYIEFLPRISKQTVLPYLSYLHYKYNTLRTHYILLVV